MFQSIKNLRADTVEGCSPWDWKQVPPADYKDTGWGIASSTEHQFYTAFEGVNPYSRVTAPAPGTEGNPPCLMHGLVLDVDEPHTDLVIETAIDRMQAALRPQWAERSASGNIRFVWALERPLPMADFTFVKHFLATIVSSWKLDSFLGGTDIPAFTNPSRYYCNGGKWTRLKSKEFLAEKELRAVEVQAAKTFNWGGVPKAQSIPLEVVYEELIKDDRFNAAWSGRPFRIGEHGPSWWVEGSDSPSSSTVFETGMYTFAAHASKPFYPWSDLLGREFVSKYSSKAITNAAEDVYFDGRTYYRKLLSGEWKGFSKEDMRAFLVAKRGLLSRARKGENCSELEEAMQFVQEHNNVDGAAPIAFRPRGLMELNGRSILNTFSRRCIQPVPGKAEKWGDGFGYIARIIDGLFSDDLQKDFFLSWLKVFYVGCLNDKLVSGHNIFMAGPPGGGKTLLARGILGKLVGGSEDCKRQLMGEDTFGSQLYEVALWNMDDGGVAANAQKHQQFSEAVKSMAANRTFSCHAKYRIPVMIQWQGRVIITCNDDADSIRILPQLEGSILDKLMIFRVGSPKTGDFLPFEEGERVIHKELPFFARFLTGFEIPQHCAGKARFGEVKEYADPQLVKVANRSSNTNVLAEIIHDLRTNLAAAGDKEFKGTAFQLHKYLCADNSVMPSLRDISPARLQQMLVVLVSKGGVPLSFSDEGDRRIWTIKAAGEKEDSQPTTVILAEPEKKKQTHKKQRK